MEQEKRVISRTFPTIADPSFSSLNFNPKLKCFALIKVMKIKYNISLWIREITRCKL